MDDSTLTDNSAVSRDIAGLPIADLARRFGTPCYVYDARRMVRQIELLRCFDVVRYAQKANSNLAILDLMRQSGVLLDAVSAGELWRAKAAGYAWRGEPAPVVFTADIFDSESLEMVAEHGIHVNCGSPDMIEQYGHICPDREVTLRINPGFGHGHSLKTNTGGPHSKHGIWHEQLEQVLKQCQRYRLAVTGMHMHIGSGSDFEHLSMVCRAMESLAATVGSSLRTISAGGGLPTPYRAGESNMDIERYFDHWHTTRLRIESQIGNSIRLEVEPGRFPVAEAGYLLTEIRAVKQMGPNRFYLVDAGFNNLARPVLYGAYHPISVAAGDGRPLNEFDDVIVGGPLCESGDIFTQGDGGTVLKRRLPSARPGDWLVIHCAGAYGFSMSSNYNSKPLAAEVLIENGRPYLIRPRQNSRDLFESEIIPEWTLSGETRSRLDEATADRR